MKVWVLPQPTPRPRSARPEEVRARRSSRARTLSDVSISRWCKDTFTELCPGNTEGDALESQLGHLAACGETQEKPIWLTWAVGQRCPGGSGIMGGLCGGSQACFPAPKPARDPAHTQGGVGSAGRETGEAQSLSPIYLPLSRPFPHAEKERENVVPQSCPAATPWIATRQGPLSLGFFPGRILQWVALPSPGVFRTE